MNQRTKFVILIVVAFAIALGWIIIGSEREQVPYVSIAEIQENKAAWEQHRFRLGGLVEPGSITYSGDRLSVSFLVVQGDRHLPVNYNGLTPDLFSDSAEVILEGEYSEGILQADNLLTKCASRYEVD